MIPCAIPASLLDRRHVLPLLTLILLLIHAPTDWYLRVPLIFLTIAAVSLRGWLTAAPLWYVLATLLGATVYLNWETADNHKYLFTYWTLALCAAFSLPKGDQEECLTLSSRWLLGLCMVFATLWKVVNPQYMDGGFFEFKLLADERFAHFGALVTGQPLASLEDNRALRDLLQEGHLRSWSVGQVQLASSAAIGWLAQLLTWWTVIIEGVLAVAFLLPDSRRAALVRNAGLLIFAATTYAVANVQGFGWALMLLGMAQCDDRDRDFRAAYLGGFLLLQIYTFPLSAIVDVVLSR